MPVALETVEHPQFMMLSPEGPTANRVLWFTGTAVFSFIATGGSAWKKDTLEFSMHQAMPDQAPALRASDWIDGVATGALASISSRDGAGFAVEWVEPYRPGGRSTEYGVHMRLAVRASLEARLYRASFALTVIARPERG